MMFGRSWHPFALFGGVILVIGALVSNETTSSILVETISPAEQGVKAGGDAVRASARAQGSDEGKSEDEGEDELDFATWAMEDDGGPHPLAAQPAVAAAAPATPAAPATRSAPARSSSRKASHNQRYDPSRAEHNLARDLTQALRKSGNP